MTLRMLLVLQSAAIYMARRLDKRGTFVGQIRAVKGIRYVFAISGCSFGGLQMGMSVTRYPTIVDGKSEYGKYKGCLPADEREQVVVQSPVLTVVG